MKKYFLLFTLLVTHAIIWGQEHHSTTKTTQYQDSLLPVIIHNFVDFRKELQSPVVLTTLNYKQIQLQSGNKDLPEILQQTPSVYTTKQGGGYGDVRINIRGFDQSNIAVLINGIPVNDMETGWVYWSNWMNLSDMVSTVQVQRGLSASKLAIPAVGGSINIYTHSSKHQKSGFVGFDYGSEKYAKEYAGYHTGILSNGLSASFVFSHFYGNGFVDMTQGESYNYFVNLEYQTKQKNNFMFTLLGGPQWHHQRNTTPLLEDYLHYNNNQNQPNIKYNQDWGYLNNRQFTWSTNFFHKPVASFNWEHRFHTGLVLYTALYTAWGRGGGTGPVGAINYHYPNDKLFLDRNGQVRFDDIYTWNTGGHIGDFEQDRTPDAQGLFLNDIDTGLTKYAFINNHSWYGMISNLTYNFSKKLKLSVGIDLRYTTGKNALTVNNILGADAYYDSFDINNPDNIIYPKDFVAATPDWNPVKSIENHKKIVFYNQSNIKWSSVFLQANYQNAPLTGFLQAGLSQQQFQRIDYFNLPAGKQKSPWVNKWGGNIKSGLMYEILPHQKIYINAGFFSKQPLFKAVFPNYNNDINNDLKNEKIYALETGYKLKNTKFEFLCNVYHTIWKDRFEITNDFIQNQQVSGKMFGLQELHTGLETTGKMKTKFLNILGMLSIGNWRYKGNIKNVKLYNFQQQLIAQKDYYIDRVKVGNAPQFTASVGLNFKVNTKLRLYINQFYVDNLYGKIDMSGFNSPNHNGALKLPSYSLVDAGISYKLRIKNLGDITTTLNVNNLFDKTYISESATNLSAVSGDDTWNGVNKRNRVFFGWGRSCSFSVKLKF